ncbi:glycosyltransferase family protein [Pontibacter arcticus]|uniref:Glycosyl transferase n=1 Tax=Pontibacter arcticus TaxID=2080288 RepID=A0A364RFB1_9BACT|nr:hypothetical protein [Pontibacter arcticus]RAU82991.1 hypothetical protein DP923_07060 [Pontibacter arcticus]
MNAVFTIVAKNYLSLARTLGDSLKTLHPDLDFYIVIADANDGYISIENEKYKILEADKLGVPNLKDLAFKYNVTEYCTAIKPFVFSHLFGQGYNKLIYFDPDIYVFNKIDHIFEILDNNFIVLTPHFITPELNYSGTVPEGGILFLGMFNLGFVAIKNSDEGRYIASWWEHRLIDKCYADKIDGFHTDQKWMDFIPVLFEKGVHISRNLGHNMAFWNIHERAVVRINQTYNVTHKLDSKKEDNPLVFFHFAGFDPNNLTYVHKYHPAFTLEDFPDLKPLMNLYRNSVLANGFEETIKWPYTFAHFDNGKKINNFQRRLYRSLTEEGLKFTDPFSTSHDSFFNLLKKSDLITSGNTNIDRLNDRNIAGFDRKRKILNRMMKTLKLTLGFEKYVLLMKFAMRYVRPENQTFLIKGLHKEIGFKHEGMLKKNQK